MSLHSRYDLGDGCGLWWRNLEEGDHLEDLGIDGSIILNCVLKK